MEVAYIDNLLIELDICKGTYPKLDVVGIVVVIINRVIKSALIRVKN